MSGFKSRYHFFIGRRLMFFRLFFFDAFGAHLHPCRPSACCAPTSLTYASTPSTQVRSTFHFIKFYVKKKGSIKKQYGGGSALCAYARRLPGVTDGRGVARRLDKTKGYGEGRREKSVTRKETTDLFIGVGQHIWQAGRARRAGPPGGTGGGTDPDFGLDSLRKRKCPSRPHSHFHFSPASGGKIHFQTPNPRVPLTVARRVVPASSRRRGPLPPPRCAQRKLFAKCGPG